MEILTIQQGRDEVTKEIGVWRCQCSCHGTSESTSFALDGEHRKLVWKTLAEGRPCTQRGQSRISRAAAISIGRETNSQRVPEYRTGKLSCVYRWLLR